jgi:hypothetical protein
MARHVSARTATGPRSAAEETALEIATVAARLIAEEGCDYSTAKRRAASDVLGRSDPRFGMPDNTLIETELRRYLRLVEGARHLRRLWLLRYAALTMMRRFAEFNPHLVGAVLNGSATEHSNIRLHLFADSAKDVEMALLNAGIDFVANEGEGDKRGERSAGAPEEQLSFLTLMDDGAGGRRQVGVVLAVHDTDAIRVAPRRTTDRSADPELEPIEASGRANLAQVEAWLAGMSAPPADSEPSETTD